MSTPIRSRHVAAYEDERQRLASLDSARKVSTRRVPIPVAVELHNVLPRIRVPTRKWYRPEYATSLLHVVRLEISILESQSPMGSSQLQPETSVSSPHRRTLHSSIHSRLTQCPVWQHLNDSIQYEDLTMDQYESLTARFHVVKDPNHLGATSEDTMNGSNTSSGSNDLFLETALHPSKLCRIARLPLHLPINCTVVRFSDHTLRIHPADYQLLLSANGPSSDMIVPTTAAMSSSSPSSSSPAHINGSHNAGLTVNTSLSLADDGTLEQRRIMFDDQVFAALDSPVIQPAKSPIRDVVSEAMDVFRDLSITNLLDQEVDDDNDGGGDSEATHSMLVNGETAAASEKARDSHRTQNGHVNDSTTLLDCEPVVKAEPHIEHHPQLQIEEKMDSDSRRQLTLDNRALELLLQRECQLLEAESTALEHVKLQLLTMAETIQKRQTHVETIQSAVGVRHAKVAETCFIVEAERIRLIRELSTLYPISVDSGRRYFIRGLEIPMLLFAGGSNVPDDTVSAAFGYLCHLVQLVSKYLGVHLRYRLHCQSSQSVIQNENGATFPLFLGRLIERDKFEYAVHLLNESIDCICRAQGIRLGHKLHILAKVMRIYEKVIEGY